MATAIEQQETYERDEDRAVDLTDVLVLSNILADLYLVDGDSEVQLENVSASDRIELDAQKCVTIMSESDEEIRALSRALGN